MQNRLVWHIQTPEESRAHLFLEKKRAEQHWSELCTRKNREKRLHLDKSPKPRLESRKIQRSGRGKRLTTIPSSMLLLQRLQTKNKTAAKALSYRLSASTKNGKKEKKKSESLSKTTKMPKKVWLDRSRIRRRKLERTKKRKQQESRTHLHAETRLQWRQQSADGNLNTAKTCSRKKDVRETRITGYRESEEEKIEKSTAQPELQCRGLRHAIRYRTADYYRNKLAINPVLFGIVLSSCGIRVLRVEAV